MKNYSQSYSFFGSLVNSKNSKFDVFVDIEYDRYDFTILNCKLACKESEAEQFHKFFKEDNGALTVSGRISDKQSIFIELAYWKRIKLNVVEVEVSQFTIGYGGIVPFVHGKYFVRIVLDDVPAVYIDSVGEMSYLGSISSNRKRDDAISWETELGVFFLADYYDYEKAEIANGKATFQIRRTKIYIEKEFNHSIETDILLKAIEDEIKDTLLILSFISRKWVNWHEINVTIFSEGEDRIVYDLMRRRKSFSREKSIKIQLFHQEVLKEDLFYKVVVEYGKSLYKEMLRRIIIFLVESNERASIEAKIQAAYSALEAITTTCCKKIGINEIFEKDRLNIIIDNIKNLLLDTFDKNKWDKNKSFDELMAKLSELRRRPFASRLIDVISLSKIEVIDMWHFPKEVVFDDKIRGIINRRNKLIHTGKIVDINQLYRDLLRIQAISERLLLFLLDCLDMDKFFISSYRDLHSIYELP